MAAVCLLGGLAVGVQPALADSSSSLQDQLRQQQQVRAQRAAAASKLDVLRANDQQVSQAVDALQNSVQAQQGKVQQAKRRSAQADQELADAKLAEAAQAARLDTLQAATTKLALQAYMSPNDELDAVFSGDDANAPYRAGLAALQASQFHDALDQLSTAQADLVTARKHAQRASVRASQRRTDAVEQLSTLRVSLLQEEQLNDRIDARMDDALNEATSLASLDRSLSAQILVKQQAIAAELARSRAAAQAAAASGGFSLPLPGSGRAASSPDGPIALVTVEGITVNASLGGQLAAMLRAAAAAGLQLGGGGYRSAAGQIAVRRNNCGPSHYNIYQEPSSQCRPPAARPGTSMHERGLAIDFTCNGVLISSHSSPCWRWLAANASRYGLFGNSREAWHWSTNGN